jgi:hypothetical protein
MSANVVTIEGLEPRPQRPTAWQAGQSGNPAGRPKGSRNRANLAVEELEDLLSANAVAIGRELVDLAKAGNMSALRLCIQRLLPAPRNRFVTFDLPPVASAADAASAHMAVLEAVTGGHLAPAEGLEVGRVIEATVRALARAEHETRRP